MRRLAIIFVVAFALNLIWENLHAVLYDNYQGGGITELILLRATLFDAIFIVLICLPFVLFPKLKSKSNWIFVLGLILAIAIELYALATGRWAYGSLMPVIPFLNIGLTPTIQLGVLGVLSFKFATLGQLNHQFGLL